MNPTQDFNHATEALALLTETFKNATVTRAILKSYASQVQLLENAIFAIINGRLLENATGDMLDIWGRVADEPRNGQSDSDYLAAIRLNVRARLSRGRAEDIIQLASLFTGITPAYLEGASANFLDGGASFTVQLDNLQTPTITARKLKKARDAGKSGQLVYTTWTPDTQTFRLKSIHSFFDGRGPSSVYGVATLDTALLASTIVF